MLPDLDGGALFLSTPSDCHSDTHEAVIPRTVCSVAPPSNRTQKALRDRGLPSRRLQSQGVSAMSLFISDESGRTSSVTDLDSTTSAGSKSSKKADLAGPGIGDYAGIGEDSSPGLQPSSDPKGNAKGNLPSAPLY